MTNINAPLIANSYITVEPSTAGQAANVTLADIADYTKEMVTFIVNGKTIHCPKFVEVNGSIEMLSYEIQEGDEIETRNFYTIGQLAEFMDVEIDMDYEILVNNRPAGLGTLVYENFTIEWKVLEVLPSEDAPKLLEIQNEAQEDSSMALLEQLEDSYESENLVLENETLEEDEPKKSTEEKTSYENTGIAIRITVNGETVELTGKLDYIFVDIFEFIDFDLADSRGRAIVTKVNGDSAGYMQPLYSGDEVEIFWKEIE